MNYPLLFLGSSLLIGLTELVPLWRERRPERWVVLGILLLTASAALVECLGIILPTVASIILQFLSPGPELE